MKLKFLSCLPFVFSILGASPARAFPTPSQCAENLIKKDLIARSRQINAHLEFIEFKDRMVQAKRCSVPMDMMNGCAYYWFSNRQKYQDSNLQDEWKQFIGSWFTDTEQLRLRVSYRVLPGSIRESAYFYGRARVSFWIDADEETGEIKNAGCYLMAHELRASQDGPVLFTQHERDEGF